MHSPAPPALTRRTFMLRGAQLALAGSAAPLALNLAAIGAAAAQTASDYKALVCVFLYGGNDHANTVVTYDEASYQRYAAARAAGAGSVAGSIVIPRTALAPTLLQPSVPLPQQRQFALHPAMTGLAGLFNSGAAALQLNVGPLVVPLTRAQYSSGDRARYPLPPKLFSHNDQQSVWQSQQAEGSTIGWGGGIADSALSGNANALFTCISVTGNSVFLAGVSAVQYQCSIAGAVAVQPSQNTFFDNTEMRSAFTQLIQQSRSHVLEDEYNKVVRRSMATESQVTAGIAGVSLSTPFPSDNSLADQLKMVAQLIGARQALGNKRQVFMVSLDGFDLHDNLVARQPVLLQKVSQALTAFYDATRELGVADQVTSFTASDFGRTLTSNGDGTDHGWGSHHFVVGAAVRGARFYGQAPPVSTADSDAADDQWHVGRGRLLPSTSVDQFAATLARWFGVADNDLIRILPNLQHFGEAAGRPDYPINLGFLG